MQTIKASRQRGFVLTESGWQKLRAKMHEWELKTGLRCTARKLAVQAQLAGLPGMHYNTIKRIVDRKSGVDRGSIGLLFQVFALSLEAGDCAPARPAQPTGARLDCSEAVDVSHFYGRTSELAVLDRWVVEARCRLVTLLGMGGIGKTALAARFVERQRFAFECIVWRSLRNAPPVEQILLEVSEFLEEEPESEPPEHFDGRLARLVRRLQKRRCLLVLDNVETVMLAGSWAGHYRPGYEGYGELFRSVGEIAHQSCLLLTGREKPREVHALEGDSLPVRSLALAGLGEEEGRKLFETRGTFHGSQTDWRDLVYHYAGNPLALKMVAPAVLELFDGEIGTLVDLLREGMVVFGDIDALLQKQCDRLSEPELLVLGWLAVEREPVSLARLYECVLSPAVRPQLLEVLRSLTRRSLVEKSGSGFTLQPVVLEFVTNRLVEQLAREVAVGDAERLNCYALVRAQGKDYLRQTQVRLVLKPVAERLLAQCGDSGLETCLKAILERQRAAGLGGYAAGNILNLLVHLGHDLSGWDYSRLVIREADLRDAHLARTDFSAARFLGCTLADTFCGILCLAFSPDGRWLATADTRGEIRLRLVETREQHRVCTGHTGWVEGLAFSTDGRILASGGLDDTVRLWEVPSGRPLGVLHGHAGGVRSVAFEPGGQYLASGGLDRTARLWDLKTGRCLRTLTGHSDVVTAVAFVPSASRGTGPRLVTASNDGTLKFWEAGRCLRTLQGHTDEVWSVALSPDGRTLASGSSDRTIRLWDALSGACLHTLTGHQDRVRAVALSPDGRQIASGSWDRTIRLWDIDGGCTAVLRGHDETVRALAFAPDRPVLASGSIDQTLKFWNLQQNHCLHALKGQGSGISSIALAAPGRLLASGGTDRIVRLWDLATGRCLHELGGHSHPVWAVAFRAVDGPSPQAVDGPPVAALLASASADHNIRLWDGHGRCLRVLRGHSSWVWSVAFSPDGRTLASSSADRSVRLWDVETGCTLRTIEQNDHRILALAYVAGEGTLAGSVGQVIRLWDVETGRCSKTLTGHSSWIWSLAASPGMARLIASGGADKSVRLWDAATGEGLAVFEGHSGWVWSVAFSPDGRRLASAGMDGTVRLWDVPSGSLVRVLDDPTVRSVVFGADGRTLVSGGEDGGLKLWSLESGECEQRLRAPGPCAGMNITGTLGLSDAQRTSLLALGAIESGLSG